MRIYLVAALVAATMLAGCTGGSNGLSSYVVTAGDVGAGFSYYQLSDEEKEESGISSNPGSFPAEQLEMPGAEAAYISALNYNGSDSPVLVSQAIRFTNETMAAQMVDEEGCGFGHIRINGAIATYIFAITFSIEDEETAEYVEAKAAAGAEAISARTGAIDPCAEA